MRSFMIMLACTCLPMAIGCSKGDFPTATTRGKVLCDGRPVGGCIVYFEPLQEGNNAIVGKQGIGWADDEGNFEVSTYGNGDGAVVGKHRVRVGWSPRNSNPSCACVVDSENDVMEVEIKAEEVNEFDVVLAKKERNHRLSADELEALEDAKDD
jgi:hypothetical protein